MKPMFSPSWFSVCLASALACGFAHADPLPTPLVQAAQTALVRSPDVQERWKAWRATQQGVPMAQAGWKPQVNVQAYTGQQDRRNPGLDLGDFSIRGVELTLSQLLFDGGRVGARVDEAHQAEVAAFHDLLGSSESVALQVVAAYLDLLRQQERVALATENYAEHQRTFNALLERSNAAVGRRSDTEQARGRLAVAESTLVAETTALRQAALAYQRQVGQLPPATLPAWPLGRGVAPVPGSALATLQQGLSSSPVLRAAFHRWQATEHATAARRAHFMPEVQARASVAESHNQNGVRGDFQDQVAEVVLQQNLYRGGADRNALRRASELQARSRAELDATCRQVQQTLSTAFNDVQTLRLREQLLDRQRLAIEKAAVAARQQFDIGQRTLLDVLDTQAEYLDSARNHVDARYDQLRAEARTLAGMGRLVALFGTAPAGDDTLSDRHPAAGFDAEAVCPAQATFMDSLERIKASLALPERRRADYVVLLPNADGSVGQVLVSGSGGEQRLTEARTGAELHGTQAPYAVGGEQVRRDFGPALDAQPVLPEKFTLYFDKGSTRLAKASAPAWNDIVQRLRARQALDITVSGHADTVSTAPKNDALALKRARAIERRLRSNGFKHTVIAVEGYGARTPEVATPDQTDEPRNRRVVITAR